MRSSKFRYLERGQMQTLVLIPGWGFDYRIFRRLNLRYNYLLPVELVPSTFRWDLQKVLRMGPIDRVSLFGWSLGGYLAVDFVEEYPHLVNGIYLVSVRRRYPLGEIRKMKRLFARGGKAGLYKFYRECFLPERKDFLWFKQNLLGAYLEGMDSGLLLEGLEYLAQSGLKAEALKGRRVGLFHGREDRIVPLIEALSFQSQLQDARLTILDGAGHVPFLSQAFEGKFHVE